MLSVRLRAVNLSAAYAAAGRRGRTDGADGAPKGCASSASAGSGAEHGAAVPRMVPRSPTPIRSAGRDGLPSVVPRTVPRHRT
jgi:hypothetical protein